MWGARKNTNKNTNKCTQLKKLPQRSEATRTPKIEKLVAALEKADYWKIDGDEVYGTISSLDYRSLSRRDRLLFLAVGVLAIHTMIGSASREKQEPNSWALTTRRSLFSGMIGRPRLSPLRSWRRSGLE